MHPKTSAKQTSEQSIAGNLCTLEELVYPYDKKEIRYQKVAELWSFYVTKCPQVGSSDTKPTCQSYILKQSGWTAEKVEKEIEKLLFEGGVEFVKPNCDFTAVARKKGFYAKRKPTCASLKAVVKINTYKQSDEDRANDKPPKPRETKGACVLRHIRNSLAHGRVYNMPNGRVLFKDQADPNGSKEVTGFMLTTPGALIELMDTLKRPCL